MSSLSAADRPWSRRLFLGVTALLGLYVGRGCRPGSEALGARAILAALGARCRAADPDLASPSAYAALCRELGLRVAEPGRWGPLEWDAMADAVRRDFESGAVVHVDGWVLARTEVIVAAACAA